jgi:hypothetical protein
MAVTGRDSSTLFSSPRNGVSIESQLLAVGSGFVVFLVLVALFATIQRRKRRSSREFHSPLIQSNHLLALKGLKPPPNTLKPGGNVIRKSLTPLQSPGGSDSSASPQCTPLTPYSSFSVTTVEPVQPPILVTQHLSKNRGKISLSLQYDANNVALQVTILGCEDLPEIVTTKEGHCLLDPYVKMRIVPENQLRVKTRVLRGTRNPFYDEQFTMFGMRPENLKKYSIHLAVLAFDRYNRDTILGEAIYSLGSPDLLNNNNEKKNVTLKLKSREEFNTESRGQVLLSMALNTQSNNINVAVLKIKDLPEDKTIGLMDPYVKVIMYMNGQKVAKHKTHVKKKTTDPVFNESFSFELPTIAVGGQLRRGSDNTVVLDAISFEILVLNYDGVTRNEVIGTSTITADTAHWKSVKEQPGRQIAEWHAISKY